jgi:hypothetical protein
MEVENLIDTFRKVRVMFINYLAYDYHGNIDTVGTEDMEKDYKRYIVNQFNVAPPALERAMSLFDNFAYFAWELCTNNPTAQNTAKFYKKSSSARGATLN